MKIWIARDFASYDDEDFQLANYLERHPEEEYRHGQLHLFYDKPEFDEDKWINGRRAASIPSYMFPNIECGECLEFSSDDIPKLKHYYIGEYLAHNE